MLPIDSLLYILTFLNVWDLLHMRRLSREWKEIIDTSPTIWKRIYKRYWPNSYIPTDLEIMKKWIISHFRLIYVMRHLLENPLDDGLGTILMCALPSSFGCIMKWTEYSVDIDTIVTATNRMIPDNIIDEITYCYTNHESNRRRLEVNSPHCYNWTLNNHYTWVYYIHYIIEKLEVNISNHLHTINHHPQAKYPYYRGDVEVQPMLVRNIYECLVNRWRQYDIKLSEKWDINSVQERALCIETESEPLLQRKLRQRTRVL